MVIANDAFAPSLAGKALRTEISKVVCACDPSSGGDRADAFEGPDGKLHLIITDFCGKGAQASLPADMVLQTMRTLLWQGLTPARVFSSVNRLILDLYRNREGFFGTGAIASFDRDHSAVLFCSAGHVDALTFNADGTRHVHHRSTGPIYGVIEDASYENAVFPNVCGEPFIMVTDGLIDVMPIDETYQRLGPSGLCRLIREIMTSRRGLSAPLLLSKVRRVAGGGFNDDAAAIVATSAIQTS